MKNCNFSWISKTKCDYITNKILNAGIGRKNERTFKGLYKKPTGYGVNNVIILMIKLVLNGDFG